jgi:hypothetical protein
MTLAEFQAVAKGYARANGAKDDAESSVEEYFEALAMFEALGMGMIPLLPDKGSG